MYGRYQGLATTILSDIIFYFHNQHDTDVYGFVFKYHSIIIKILTNYLTST